MSHQTLYEPGEKTHRDENFPVASRLIPKEHRPAILAFYRFARAADDVADHPHLVEKDKIALLDRFEATLLGASDAVQDALPLREIIFSRGLSSHHALDLLVAFRQDACNPRYKNWDELMQYCRYSAASVGRFVLDVHGESPSIWLMSDALCAVLQIINHIQDCRADYQRLKRIYIPQDMLTHYSIPETALDATQSSPALRSCLIELVKKTQSLLTPPPLSAQIHNGRLMLEVLAIERMAQSLLKILLAHDPLGERVHLTRLRFISVMANATFRLPLLKFLKKAYAPLS